VRPRNVTFAAIAWPGSGSAKQDLDKIFDQLLDYGEHVSQWYLGEKRLKSAISKCMRLIAIFLAIGGIFVPLLALVRPGFIATEWGYLMFAGAAGCVGIDKFFGFSSAWRRYVTAAIQIQALMGQLSIARVEAGATELANIGKLADTWKEYLQSVDQIVSIETDAWCDEFRSEMNNFRLNLGSATGTLI
jgi:hypothetical protein